MTLLPQWLLKFGFHLLYHQLAWTYDWVAWGVSFGQWAAWRRLALHYMRPGPILELAYGTGGLFADMLDAGYRPAGIDRSPYMARLAKHRLAKKQYPAPLSRATAQALPFPSGCFATIVATFPTNYIFDHSTLAEARRVLKPAGRLIIVVEGQLRGPWPLRPLIDWLYKITDQHNFPAINPLPLFEQHNFTARWQIARHEGVSAKLLIADKR